MYKNFSKYYIYIYICGCVCVCMVLIRSFRVNVQGKYSCIAKIDCGVPQVSILLGPFLFLLHVNDMKQAVDYDLFLNADDSCLVYQHKDVKEIERNKCLWLEKTKQGVYYLAQNIDIIKSVALLWWDTH